jgi:hypothetical protein
MKKIFLAAITLSSLLVACKKGSAPAADSGSEMLGKFLRQNEPQFSKFTVNAATGGTVTTPKGSTYRIRANSLLGANGMPVTGNVDVFVKEINQASEMILGNKPTNSGTGVLRSFGEMQIIAQQNGNNLTLRQDSTIVGFVRPPQGGTQLPIDIPMWAGDSLPRVTSNGHNHLNQSTSVSGFYLQNTGIDWSQIPGSFANLANGGYNFNIRDLLTWGNCDQLYNIPGGAPTTVLCYFGNNFNETSFTNLSGTVPSQLFYKPRNVNAIVKFTSQILNPAPGKYGYLSYQNSFKVGQEGTFLAMSAKDGKFYGQILDYTVPAPASGNNYVGIDLNLQEVTEAQLLALINQMNTR